MVTWQRVSVIPSARQFENRRVYMCIGNGEKSSTDGAGMLFRIPSGL